MVASDKRQCVVVDDDVSDGLKSAESVLDLSLFSFL